MDSLLTAMNEVGVRKILFSSSASVYGNPIALPISEDHPIAPISCYAKTKAICESNLRDKVIENSQWSSIVLRYFNPVGCHPSGVIGEFPNQPPESLFPIIGRVATGSKKELEIYGSDYDTPDGTAIRDFIHIEDLAEAHVAILNSFRIGECDVYNAGTGEGYSILQVIAKFEEACNLQIPYVIKERRLGDVSVSYANINKISSSVGWKSKYSLEQMCRDTWRWQKSLAD